MSILFPEQVTTDFVKKLDPKVSTWGRTSKNKLLDLLAAQSSQDNREAILKTYVELFPDDAFVTEAVKKAATRKESAGVIQR